MKKRRQLLSDDHASGSFVFHLDQFRWTLICSAGALLAGMLICLPFSSSISRFLQRPLPPSLALQSIEVTGALMITLSIIFWGGVIVSSPFLFYVTGRFVFPAVKPRQRDGLVPAVIVGAGLFVVGTGMGYMVTLPLAIRLMLTVHHWIGVHPLWTINSYIRFALQVLLGFGLAFEFPLFLFMLGRFGVVKSSQLRRYRREVAIALLVLAMLLTPPDIITQVLLALPLYLSYEACTLSLFFMERKR